MKVTWSLFSVFGGLWLARGQIAVASNATAAKTDFSMGKLPGVVPRVTVRSTTGPLSIRRVMGSPHCNGARLDPRGVKTDYRALAQHRLGGSNLSSCQPAR